CWKAVYRAARVSNEDRIFFPFSFGPFLGFWTGFDAATQIGAHTIPSGGMTSHSRLTLIDTVQPTVVCCTPTYALRLLDVAQEIGLSLSSNSVGVVIVAGEPGGSIPATRKRIEDGWGARVIDHYGLTEVGPIGFECWQSPGSIHINEQGYIAEIIDPETCKPIPDGQQGELVITNLGRIGSPVIRYRTRDLVVRTLAPCACGRTFARLVGGVTARADDMVNVRGVNVYPSAIEAIIRTIPEVLEYRCTVTGEPSNRSVSIEVELMTTSNANFVVEHVTNQIRQALGLTVPVQSVETGSLPRFEMKARRFLVE
ncbi:MAG: AMP-binding protein, partial [Acidobacteriota bacterium]|nr:AMP-binding protein [Acidobacteriota bacterium]